MLWGTRSPVLAEPLVQGTTWNSVGGSTNDVTASNRYRGVVDISVPAFPAPVKAAKIESVITQAGALGDPFGSGLRTVWWVYGVGPVKVLFQHTSGETSYAQLQSTNLAPLPLPSDANLLPLALGAESSVPLAQLQAHEALVRAAAHGRGGVEQHGARQRARHHGPDRRQRAATCSRTGSAGSRTSPRRCGARTRARGCPQLGPAKGPKGRARFVTPLDLMTYGFNPVFPAYAATGQAWRSSRESPTSPSTA